MKLKLFIITLICFAINSVNAQDLLKGTVRENGSNARITNVFIKDINNNQLTLADKEGNFAIRSATGHTLVINSPGYISDTLYVIDMSPKKIKMSIMTIALREVNINSSRRTFNPQEEYPQVYQKSKVYILSPSSWFGKESRDARHLKRYFAVEEQERYIDGIFTTTYVGSLVPLKGQQLEDFMEIYRPTYAFLKGNSTQTLAVYVNDSYKKYMALPPNQRKLPQLSDQ
jgi:hypothetical protein